MKKLLLIAACTPCLLLADGLINVGGNNPLATNVLTVASGGSVAFPPAPGGGQLVIANDGNNTIQFNILQNGWPTSLVTGLGGGGGFFRSTGGGVIYFDADSAKIGNDGTSQVFLCNAGGGMDIVDASGSGVHLDGFGNFIIDTAIHDASGNTLAMPDGSGGWTFPNGAVLSSAGHFGQTDESTGQTYYFHINSGVLTINNTP